MRGFLKRPERRGSASGVGGPGASGSGVGETRGYRGFPVPRGPRELGVAPVGRAVGGGETEGGRGRGDRERRKGTEYGDPPLPAKGSRRRRKGLRGGDLERTPPGRDRGALPPTAALGLESEPRTLGVKASSRRSWDWRLG